MELDKDKKADAIKELQINNTNLKSAIFKKLI